MIKKLLNSWTQKSRRFKTIALTVAIFMVVVRLCIPLVVKQIVLGKLNKIEGYSASIQDVDVSIFPPSVTFDNLAIFSDSIGEDKPLFKADQIKGQLLFSSIKEGKFLTHSSAKNPVLSFMQFSDTNNRGQVQNKINYLNSDQVNWREEIDKLFALTVNRLDVEKGEIHFKNTTNGKNIEVLADSIYASFENIANSKRSQEELYSSGYLVARIMNHAPLEVAIDLAPSSTKKLFEMDLRLSSLDITTMNSYWREYVNLDVESGHFNLQSRIVMENGILNGKVYPTSNDFDIFNLKYDKSLGLKNMAWQGLVGIATKLLLLEKYEKDKVCKIDFVGTFQKFDVRLRKNSEIVLSKLFVDAVNDKIKPHKIHFEKIE